MLSVVTVLTLLLLGLTADLQPEPTLASPGTSAPFGETASYLDDDANGNTNGNNGDTGGGGFFFPCAISWFANNPACTFGLFGG